MQKCIILLLATLTQCSFKINNTNDGYNDLAKSKKKNIAQFADIKEAGSTYQFVEITAGDLKEVASHSNYTIIYQLAPWCTPCIKQFKKDYKTLDSLAKRAKDAKIFVVNNSYGFENSIERLYKSIGFVSPIYVLSNSVYGSNIENKVAKFVKEICDSCEPNSNGGVFLLDGNASVLKYSLKVTDWHEILVYIKQ